MKRFTLPALLLLPALISGSCQNEPAGGMATAFRANDRAQLFGGGPRALGDVGDYVLMNDKIRLVIQQPGYSRGFGVYGGGIIDADLRRPDEEGRQGSIWAGGKDIFAEMFPAFFFQAVACDKVEVLADGTKAYAPKDGETQVHYDAGTAVIRASGAGGEFLSLLKLFDGLLLGFLIPTDLHSKDGGGEAIKLATLLGAKFDRFQVLLAEIVNENVRYETDYILKPGARHVEIRARMINLSDSKPLAIPSEVLGNKLFQERLGGLDLTPLRVPFGMVMLYGLLNNVWLPGAGFDLRHPIDHAFKRALPLPGFSGVVTEFIASSSARRDARVSYGYAAEHSPTNFVNLNSKLYRDGGTFKDSWTPIDDASLLIPFTAISFIGVFADSFKGEIPPGEFVGQTQHFIVGAGDVASIADEYAVIRGQQTGRYEGFMRDARNGQLTDDGQLVIYQALDLTTDAFVKNGSLDEGDYLDAGLRPCDVLNPKGLCRPYSQDYPDVAGNLGGNLPPGIYAYRVQAGGRPLGPFVKFEIAAGKRTFLDVTLSVPAWVQAIATDNDGIPIPAKVSLLGKTDRALTDAQRRSGAVFDLQAGEGTRFTDMLPDADPAQRAYIEGTGYTNADGRLTMLARPGDYVAYFSRGLEYDVVSVPVHVEAGNVAQVGAKLTRVVDTRGWLSLDNHVHSIDSIDSRLVFEDRVRSAAGEGLEIAIATDHNFVSDWRPTVAAQGLEPWIASFPGIEFTTLESGHFNSFPLAYPTGPITHGAGNWQGRPPKELFASLRAMSALGGNDSNIIVLNHPRDAIQGYFNQYGRSSLTGGNISQGSSKRLAGPNGPAFYDADGVSTISYDFDAMEILNGKLGHEIHGFRAPADWPAPCYQPLPPNFDPKTMVDGCRLNGKVLRPSDNPRALVPGTLLLDVAPSAEPGLSGIDNVEATFPGAVDDWFHMLNQGYRKTGLATSDSHATAGEEPGWPRTYLRIEPDRPGGVDPATVVDVIKNRHAATLSNGPFLTFTVAPGSGVAGGTGIGGELQTGTGPVTLNIRLAAAPWVSVSRIQVYKNGRLIERIPIDPKRNLADTAAAPNGPFTRQLTVNVDKDSWFVLEAVGEKAMFPVITGTEEPFLLVSDAVGALAGALGLSVTTDIGAVVVGNPPPYALTNPIWVKTTDGEFQPPGVVPFDEINVPSQDPKVGVMRSRN